MDGIITTHTQKIFRAVLHEIICLLPSLPEQTLSLLYSLKTA